MTCRGFKPETIARLAAKRKAELERVENIVLSALHKLGGRFQGRIMMFRHHLSESLREAQIKDAIKRLVDAGKVRVIGEKNSHKGNLYEVTE